MNVIILPLQGLLSEEYIEYLRTIPVIPFDTPAVKYRFKNDEKDYPHEQLLYGICSPVLQSQVVMKAALIAFHDTENDFYFISKNRYNGHIGWYDKDYVQELTKYIY